MQHDECPNKRYSCEDTETQIPVKTEAEIGVMHL